MGVFYGLWNALVLVTAAAALAFTAAAAWHAQPVPAIFGALAFVVALKFLRVDPSREGKCDVDDDVQD